MYFYEELIKNVKNLIKLDRHFPNLDHVSKLSNAGFLAPLH